MQLTSLTFIYLFLPVCMFFYYILPSKMHPLTLLVFSLFYYFLAQPFSLLLMLLSIVMDFIALKGMKRFDNSERFRRSCLWFSVIKNLSMIVYAGVLFQTNQIVAVFGLMVYTLSGMGCVISVYRRKTKAVDNIIHFALYCSFFPRLYAGPMVDFNDFILHFNSEQSLEKEKIAVGLNKFLMGALKQLLFVNLLDILYDVLKRDTLSETSVISSWFALLVFALSLYYRYSGFCDMAQGIALLFGMKLPQNFYFPYQSRNILDFFARFNSTFTDFLNEIIFDKLQDDSDLSPRAFFKTLLFGMLFGLWFGIDLNFLLWGIFLGVFAILEKFLYKKFLKRIPTLFSRMLTLIIVLVSFVFFKGLGLSGISNSLFDLFGLGGNPLYTSQILHIISSNLILIIVAGFFATNIYNLVALRIKIASAKIHFWLIITLDAALLVLVTSLLL